MCDTSQIFVLVQRFDSSHESGGIRHRPTFDSEFLDPVDYPPNPDSEEHNRALNLLARVISITRCETSAKYPLPVSFISQALEY